MKTTFSSKKFVAAVKAHIKAHPEMLKQDHAEYLGVSKSTVNRWFDGTRTPTTLSAQQVAKALRKHKGNMPTIKAIIAACV